MYTLKLPIIEETHATQSVGHHIHVYIHVYTHIYAYKYIHMYAYKYIHIYIYIYKYVYTSKVPIITESVGPHIHVYLHVYIYNYIHTHIYKYIHIYVYTLKLPIIEETHTRQGVGHHCRSHMPPCPSLIVCVPKYLTVCVRVCG